MRKQPYNILLVKDGVGKSKPTVRDLPHESFTYGKPEIRDKEGVGDGKLKYLIQKQFHRNGNTINIVIFQSLTTTSKHSTNQLLKKEQQQRMYDTLIILLETI